MRKTTLSRKTAETDIKLTLNLDGEGRSNIKTGCGFFDHMLTLFAKHGSFDIELFCNGDTDVDYHHSVEDIGIVLGEAFKTALGDCAGIKRYGSMLLPMDEALVLCALDISGRSYLQMKLLIPTQKVGAFDTELVNEFFVAFCRSAGITLHIRLMDGTNSHHIIEATFKAFARAMNDAVTIIGTSIPSTKGII
ncbi:MAG: imidazoleglycerol-phosphate dehydratase HisB [Ruminococcaceae bacterium]|nr:imidazoleglycerol-phosphate dehydratase HisB [Oscillospiraceae bacterium]